MNERCRLSHSNATEMYFDVVNSFVVPRIEKHQQRPTVSRELERERECELY